MAGLFSWLLMPAVTAYLTLPGFDRVIAESPVGTLCLVFFLGLLWGVGGLTYGLGVRYLGMSLGNSVILGLCSVCGSLVPAIYYDHFPVANKVTFSMMCHSTGGWLVLLGLAVCLYGIFLCGQSGQLREQEQADKQRDRNQHKQCQMLLDTEAALEASQPPGAGIDLRRGLVFASVSGMLSACFNFGIEAGKPLADACVERGMLPIFQNNVIYVVSS